MFKIFKRKEEKKFQIVEYYSTDKNCIVKTNIPNHMKILPKRYTIPILSSDKSKYKNDNDNYNDSIDTKNSGRYNSELYNAHLSLYSISEYNNNNNYNNNYNHNHNYNNNYNYNYNDNDNDINEIKCNSELYNAHLSLYSISDISEYGEITDEYECHLKDLDKLISIQQKYKLNKNENK